MQKPGAFGVDSDFLLLFLVAVALCTFILLLLGTTIFIVCKRKMPEEEVQLRHDVVTLDNLSR